ncbi:MAG TPA: serine hydrolase domain-containing protein, partial [Bacillota bacterium]|nr:serine hydrolase domain-containing protein [Bacillota bacterium]
MKNSMKKLKIMILGLVFVMVIVISGSTLAANPPIPVHSYVCTLATEQEQQIDDYLLQVMKTGAVPGTAVVIVKDGRPVYMKGFGYADLQAKTPVTPRTM